MDAAELDEGEFYAVIAAHRVLLIGRRAMVALGIPIGTFDYEVWVHPDDIEALNAALRRFDLSPNRPAAEARTTGRYILENDERVDVLVARQVSTVDGVPILFDDVLARSHRFEVAPGAVLPVPRVSDLIATKRFAARAKDLEDIRLLEALREEIGE
jgi:hypothetical protein